MNFDTHAKIDKFLIGEMNESESTEFLSQVEHDSDLQHLIESERLISNVIAKDKVQLMEYDLSKTATSFVATLAAANIASSEIVANSGITVAKTTVSISNIIASTFLSVGICAAGYFYFHESDKNPDLHPVEKNTTSFTVVTQPSVLTLSTPKEIILVDKKPIKKQFSNIKINEGNQSLILKEVLETPKPQKIKLEHSLSKYRPTKVQQ